MTTPALLMTIPEAAQYLGRSAWWTDSPAEWAAYWAVWAAVRQATRALSL